MCFNHLRNDPDLIERAYHESGHSIIGYRYHYIIVGINCTYGHSGTNTNYAFDMTFALAIQKDNYATLTGMTVDEIVRCAKRYSDYLIAGSYAWNFQQTGNVNQFQVNSMFSNEFDSDFQRLQRTNAYVQGRTNLYPKFIQDTRDRVKANLQNPENRIAINELAKLLIRKANHSFNMTEFQAFVARLNLLPI